MSGPTNVLLDRRYQRVYPEQRLVQRSRQSAYWFVRRDGHMERVLLDDPRSSMLMPRRQKRTHRYESFLAEMLPELEVVDFRLCEYRVPIGRCTCVMDTCWIYKEWR